jgi:hypothetical protein
MFLKSLNGVMNETGLVDIKAALTLKQHSFENVLNGDM